MASMIDARKNFFTGSLAHFMAEDRLFVADLFVNIADGASYYIGLTPDGGGAVIAKFSLDNRSNQSEIELYEGGTYSGGSPLEIHNLNRRLNQNNAPFSDSSQGVTINTVGTRIYRRTQLGSTDNKAVTLSGDSIIGFVLAPSIPYYIHVRNDDGAKAADYNIRFVAAG